MKVVTHVDIARAKSNIKAEIEAGKVKNKNERLALKRQQANCKHEKRNLICGEGSNFSTYYLLRCLTCGKSEDIDWQLYQKLKEVNDD